MADIHLLAQSTSSAGVGRSASALVRALEVGHDLGERGYHIRAIGRAIAATQQLLRQKLDEIRLAGRVGSIEQDTTLLQLETIAREIEQLAAIAMNYETVDDPVPAVGSQFKPVCSD